MSHILNVKMAKNLELSAMCSVYIFAKLATLAQTIEVLHHLKHASYTCRRHSKRTEAKRNHCGFDQKLRL